MRKLLFTISLITAVLTVTAQPAPLQFNEYGEVKTKLITGSVSHAWAVNPLQAYKDTLIKYLGEGMYYEVLNHSSLNNWPEGTNTVKKYFNVQQQFTGYNLYYMYEWSDYVILRVPYKQNTHMPANLQSVDKTDFYLLASYRDIDNSSAAYKARKNKPASYPESLYERNYEKTTPAAESNYSKGRELHNKKQYTEALAFYKLAYEKDSSATAAYNIGAMYYNKELTIQKGYSTNDVLKGVTGNGAEENETYKEAVTWFKKAAAKNFVQAMYALGLAYRDGDGVKKDIAEAKKWFTKAAAKGDEKARQALEKL